MSDVSALPCYGEWPAHHARMGDLELTFTVLSVKVVDHNVAVLIGVCPAGDHRGSHDCSAEANGYRWTFRGSVFDQRGEGAGRVRVRVMSEGDVAAEPLEEKHA